MHLRPNLGAEEPGAPDTASARSAARLWRLLFPATVDAASGDAPAWPEAFAEARHGAVFPWLPSEGLCAWWNDAASVREAEASGLHLFGAPPAVVARVHDKAFALGVAERAGGLPRILRGRICRFEPDELRDTAAARARLRRELASWPSPLASRFTLKPRLGTSGRGRIDATSIDDPRLIPGFARLAERGGALLEPWLERRGDTSVQLHVAEDGTLTVLGVLRLCTSAAGIYRGHRGELDHRGRVVSGTGYDDELLGAACELARAAHAEGFHGPCGVDSFAFEWEGRALLRPIVELNARFTMGTVVLGLLRRARPWIGATLGPRPEERLAFDFAFRAGAPASRPDVARLELPDAVLSVGRDPAQVYA